MANLPKKVRNEVSSPETPLSIKSPKNKKKVGMIINQDGKVPKIMKRLYELCIENEEIYFHELGGVIITDLENFKEYDCLEKIVALRET